VHTHTHTHTHTHAHAHAHAHAHNVFPIVKGRCLLEAVHYGAIHRVAK
jgi:hypothetical protein